MAGKKGNGEGTIIRRDDGRWCAAVTIGRNSKGKIIRKWIYGKSRNEVAKQMTALLFEVNRDSYIEPCKRTFSEYCKKWVELYKKPGLKPKSYDRMLNTHTMISKSSIGSEQMYQIDTDSLQAYISSLTGDFSYSTIKKVYDLFNACFKHALMKEDIKANPCVGVTLPREPEDINEVTAFSMEQQKIVIDEITRTYSTGRDVYRYGYGYIFIMNTGLRLGEALALTWKDIDFEKRLLTVNKNLVKVRNSNSTDKNYILKIQSPKTKASRRKIPLNDKAIFALMHLKKLPRTSNSNIIFCNVTGKYIDPSNVSELFSSVCKRMGLAGFTVHSLRHTFATNLFRKNVDVKYISELLGHADIKTTYNTYIHLLADVNDFAIAAINSL